MQTNQEVVAALARQRKTEQEFIAAGTLTKRQLYAVTVDGDKQYTDHYVDVLRLFREKLMKNDEPLDMTQEVWRARSGPPHDRHACRHFTKFSQAPRPPHRHTHRPTLRLMERPTRASPPTWREHHTQ